MAAICVTPWSQVQHNTLSCPLLYYFVEMSLASQNMYRTVKEAYEPEWVGYTELTAAVEVSAME